MRKISFVAPLVSCEAVLYSRRNTKNGSEKIKADFMLRLSAKIKDFTSRGIHCSVSTETRITKRSRIGSFLNMKGSLLR
jgi:hypothetical protein